MSDAQTGSRSGSGSGIESSGPQSPALIRTPPTTGGMIGAYIFWWASMGPSLLPRSWIVQAGLSALAIAVGYGVGTGLGVATRKAATAARKGMPPHVATPRWLPWALGVLAAAGVVARFVIWNTQQNDQRVLVEVVAEPRWKAIPAAVVTALLAVLLLALGRWVGRGIAHADRVIGSIVKSRLLRLAATAVVIVGAGSAVYNLTTTVLIDFVDTQYGNADKLSDEPAKGDPEQPTAATVSGSPDSEAPWDSLGAEGRNFVAGATPTKKFDEFTGGGSVDPIRVYAGLRTADSPEDRAAIVVDELDRTGAKDRAVVMVAAATGTGWVDPKAVKSIEYMYGGNTATASQQYSFLPSWISFLVDQEKAGDTAAALNDAVHDWWSRLPGDSRPKLIVFGQSLGSLGAEAAFAEPTLNESLDALVARTDGVLLTGPTYSNKIWRQIIAGRNPDTPVWEPETDSPNLFVANQPDEPATHSPWLDPRILYFHHPSDPVGYWNMSILWSRPEWTQDPIGYDVSPDVSWFPGVTWSQVVADLMAGFSTPSGFGHNYSEDFVSGWSAIVPPIGWSQADSQRLTDHLGF